MAALVEHTCVLTSPLSLEAAREALRSVVANTSDTSGNSAPFRGEVGDGGFRIVRTISYRNSFLPVIAGRLFATAQGSRVNITMNMHAFTSALMTFWLGFAKLFVVLGPIGAIVMLERGEQLGAIVCVLIPAAMYAGGRGMLSFGFWREVRRAKRLLAEALKAQDVR